MEDRYFGNYLEVEVPKNFETSFELFDCVNYIGDELTKKRIRGVFLDLGEVDRPEEILTTIKSGIRTSFPLIRSFYLAYRVKEVLSDQIDVDPVVFSKGFKSREAAIQWLDEKLN